MESILDVQDKMITDESIEENEFHEYEPQTGVDLNKAGEIRINIETQNIYTHPSERYLHIEGQIVKKADGTACTADDKEALTNNGLMHVFSNIKY